ncbi:elongation of very long chain fatty acids protein 4-like [Trichogramma pretiosum]|uniref:elongation of very long chain fatty acids protein 4-like n=1 Tax=Trichogramma pretiosum TaxID=7493 RepID=UPI0006C9520D|nr:elongation of very long chain fatty acids protein 4-like [Trichogramma pretiosum]
MEVWNWLKESYLNTETDDRTKDYLIVKYEWSMYLIFAGYLYFVLRCGPRYMQDKEPWSCKTFIKYYNIFQIIYNYWIVHSCIKYGLFTDFGLGCVFVDRSPVGRPMELVNVYYWTLVLKMIDLVETGVFVLRKKQRQISFLHLYHHISTIYIAQMSVRYFPGGMATVPIVVNSSIHVVMYTYYLLSSQGPSVQKIINPFKPYITIMQMVQFFFLLGHTLQAFMPYCHVPKWGAVVMVFNLFMNFILFYNFYRQNYKAPTKAKVEGKKN